MLTHLKEYWLVWAIWLTAAWLWLGPLPSAPSTPETLRKDMVDTFNRCMAEGRVEGAFSDLKEYCTWVMAQVAKPYMKVSN